MKEYLLLLSVVSVAMLIFTIPAFITLHKRNTSAISDQRMHSREIAEALVGKKIDWND